jgi:Ser/Thr protein kinase RdoA (MazF antagonist)
VVPPFFAHEGSILAALAAEPVPLLLGHDGGRVLLAEAPGEDLYEAALPRLLEMVTLLVALQMAWRHRLDDLQALGLPDWRGAALTAAISDVLERTRVDLPADDAMLLDNFIAGLPRRFLEIASCGLPDTLVHGDFHPGNFRGTAAQLTLLDWGDSCIGHPLLDQPAFLSRIAVEHVEAVRTHWHIRWRDALPVSDPAHASKLLAPVAAARQAVIYQKFLDNIEPSERVYHRTDPAAWLQRTAALLREEG